MLNQLKDVFKSLESHKVRYVVIGGIAAVLYGVPSSTFDLDILIDSTLENAQKLLDALLESNLGSALLTDAQQVLSHEISVFEDRVRIDVQTRTPGITFAKAWEDRVTMDYRGQKLYVISRDHLIATKLAAGRDIDLEDVRILKKN